MVPGVLGLLLLHSQALTSLSACFVKRFRTEGVHKETEDDNLKTWIVFPGFRGQSLTYPLVLQVLVRVKVSSGKP